MNDILQQLLQLGPGIGAGLSGNGPAMSAFMEGFQRTQQMMEEKKRRTQMDTLGMQDRDLALQDRERGIARQQTSDANAAQDRGQQQALRSLQIPGQLAELGSAAEDPQGAKALIESAMPKLMAAFGQDTMAMGQPAVEMATQTITGRQKKQVEAYVEQAMKTSFVADNPDADPELVNLPEHIARIVGKPQAKLSELQQFAQLPIEKPAGKTRIPPATGSMEEYSDPATTPERRAEIERLRKGYSDAGRVPNTGDPEVAGLRKELLGIQVDNARRGDDGSLTPRQLSQSLQMTNSLKGHPAYMDMSDIATGWQGVNVGLKQNNGFGDITAINAFQRMVDPGATVREGDVHLLQSASSWMDTVLSRYPIDRLKRGDKLPAAVRERMRETAKALYDLRAKNYNDTVGTQYRRLADAAKIPFELIGTDFAVESAGGDTLPSDSLPPMAPVSSRGPTRLPGNQSASPATVGSDGRLPAAQLRERRKFGDELREWNGSRWVLVTPQ